MDIQSCGSTGDFCGPGAGEQPGGGLPERDFLWYSVDAPFRADISGALRRGSNELEITVTNTWANRLAGDHALPEEERVTQTTAPWRLEGCPLLPAGMKGPVTLVRELR